MQRGSGSPRDDSMHAASLLLREILNLTDDFERRLGEHLEVNRTDLEAMEQLIMDGPLSPTEIARRLGVTTAAATTVVDRLVAVGHASRQPHPTDRRAVLVVPHAASVQRAMTALLPLIRGVDAVANDFDERERATIVRYLEAIADVYREQITAAGG